MINFVIYEDNNELVNNYIESINMFIKNKNVDYFLYKFNNYSEKNRDKIINKIDGVKIFIINISIYNSFDIVKDIREYGDWDSVIIMVSSNNKNNCASFISKLYDISIINGNNIYYELLFSLNVSFDVLNRYSTLVFKSNNEMCQIYYKDICYIEKNLNNNDSTIVTWNNRYVIKCSINKMLEFFKDNPYFYKSHRSCIVNLRNVTSFDINKNIIYFKDKSINLVSRDRRSEFKDILLSNGNRLKR